MIAEQEYPKLAQLVGGGFNQDWQDIWGSPDQVVSMFAGTQPTAARLLGEIDRLVEQDEESIRNVLTELGNGYDFAGVGATAAGWLRSVATQVEREAPPFDLALKDLVGQVVVSIETTPVMTAHLDRTRIFYPAGMGFSSPAGAGVVAAGDSVDGVSAAFGEVVVGVGTNGGELVIGTSHVELISLVGDDGPVYRIEY